MLPLWAEWAECTDPELYIKGVFKNSDRVFEHPFFSLFAPLPTPGSAEKKVTPDSARSVHAESKLYFYSSEIYRYPTAGTRRNHLLFICVLQYFALKAAGLIFSW